MIEDFDQRIWALLSGRLSDAAVRHRDLGDAGNESQEIKNVARILNDEFIPRVIGVLKKLGVDEITSEEIAKEAVDKAVNAYNPGRAKFLTFVTKIALNIRIDRYRRGLLPNLNLQSLKDDIPTSQEVFDDPSEAADHPEESEFVKRVRSVLSLLSQEDRILIQFDIQEMPKESYMQLYGIGKTAYRQRKSRAYARLRDLYKRKYP